MFVTAPIASITVTLILYLLQGVVLGLSTSIPVYLKRAGASWKQQGHYSFAHYPFSIKLIWAPVIDVFYIQRLGRRQTWLLPVQACLGVALIALSFYIESFIDGLQVILLTILVFIVLFFTATQDICVDGWALNLFASTNVVWQSTSQTIGQTFGRFLGSSFLLTFRSANFTNEYIRQPLSIPPADTGLFTLAQFVRFWGIAFLVVTCIVAFVYRQRPSNENNNDIGPRLKLFEIYLSILKILRKKCMLELAFILLVSPFGYAATYFLTNLALINNGMSEATLGLITMPIIFVKILVPLILSQTHRPLIWFTRLYPPRLIISVVIGVYVFFTPQLIKYPRVFYSVLITLFIINETIIYLQLVARVGFYAQVSDPRIGGTYMTLVSTLGNIGQTVSNSAVTYAADWLPKQHSYSIEVAACTIIGIIFLLMTWRMMHRLQQIPSHKWYLTQENGRPVETNTQELLATRGTEKI